MGKEVGDNQFTIEEIHGAVVWTWFIPQKLMRWEHVLSVVVLRWRAFKRWVLLEGN